MALKTSLVIAGDASGAQAAIDTTNAGLQQTDAQAEATAQAFAKADVAITKLGVAQAQAKREIDAAKAAFAAEDLTLEQLNRQLLETKSALSLVEDEHRKAMAGLRDAKKAGEENTVSLGQQRAGYQNLGRQMQDVAVMARGGMSIGAIISTQGPQVADAVAMMGGKMSGFASFLAGPYGAAVFFAGSILVDSLIPAIFDTGEESEKSKVKVANLSGGIAALEENAKSAAEAMADLRKEMDKSSTETKAATDVTTTLINGMGEIARINRDIKRTQDLLADVATSAGGAQAAEGLNRRLVSLEQQRASVQKKIDTAKSDLKDIGDLADAKRMQDAAEEKLNTKPKKPKKDTSAERAAKAASRLQEFGEDTGSRIANIRDQFSDLPAQVTRANKAMRDLDDIASDIEKRRPPNYSTLKPALADARRAVEDSLLKPFNDYLKQAEQAAQIDALLGSGREDEAAALQVVLSLQDKMNPLTDEQLDTVLETVRAERQRSMVLRDQKALIQANIDAVYDMRTALEQTVADMLRGKFSLKNIISSIGNSAIQGMSQRVVESMFGDTLRALEDKASGQQYVEKAGKGMAQELDKASAAVLDWRDAVQRATIKPGAAASTSAGTSSGGAAAGGASSAASGAEEGGDIVVTAKRGNGNFVVEMLNQVLRPLGVQLPKELTDIMNSFLNKLEVSLPEVMKGALTGATASKLILGDSGSGLGGAIGGAIGGKLGEQFLSKGLSTIASGLGSFAGPIGSIAGGIIGGVVGGLFKKAKWGTSVVTGQSDDAVSTSGNKATYRSNSSGAAGSVQDMIAQIADQLGGSATGAYNVSIGQYKGNWRVSTTGRTGKLKSKYGDVTDFGEDGAEAAALYAALDAISDGAIKGISAAVQKALKSSDDLEKAVSEALKVQEVELLIGGLGAQLEKAFQDFETQAQERLRIAKEYGFDIVAVEQRNAEDRLKLSEQLLEQQVGSLQSLLSEMTSGSLFEGTAMEQREALLAEIEKARAAANAGEDGAADKLATLLEQLNSVSKDAFGTTGGFAADRDLILDAAREAIAQANKRITEAQAATSDPALATTNAALDENNDQNAQIISQLAQTNSLLAKLAASGSVNLAALATTAWAS